MDTPAAFLVTVGSTAQLFWDSHYQLPEMAARCDGDMDDWETLEDDFPSASAASGAHYSKRLHAQPARRAGASHRSSANLPAASSAAMARSPRVRLCLSSWLCSPR